MPQNPQTLLSAIPSFTASLTLITHVPAWTHRGLHTYSCQTVNKIPQHPPALLSKHGAPCMQNRFRSIRSCTAVPHSLIAPCIFPAPTNWVSAFERSLTKVFLNAVKITRSLDCVDNPLHPRLRTPSRRLTARFILNNRNSRHTFVFSRIIEFISRRGGSSCANICSVRGFGNKAPLLAVTYSGEGFWSVFLLGNPCRRVDFREISQVCHRVAPLVSASTASGQRKANNFET